MRDVGFDDVGASRAGPCSTTFRFSRDYMRAQLTRLQDLSQPENQVAFRLNLPPEYLLIHRVWLGGIGVLSQVGGTVPLRDSRDEATVIHCGPGATSSFVRIGW